MENKNLVFLPDDVYKELKEKNHFSGKNSRSVIGTVHLD